MHPELRGVRRQEDVERERLLRLEGPGVVVANHRIQRHPAHADAGIDAAHIDDADLVGPSILADVERETRGTLGVARVMVRGEHDAAERDRIAVPQPSIDGHRLEACGRILSPAKVGFAAALEQLRIGLRHDHLRLRESLELGQARHVIEVPVRCGQHLDVRDIETEQLDPGRDLRHSLRKAGVDQDMTRRRRDEIRRQIVGPDPVDVANQTERRKRLHPLRTADALGRLRPERHRDCACDEQHRQEGSLDHRIDPSALPRRQNGQL